MGEGLGGRKGSGSGDRTWQGRGGVTSPAPHMHSQAQAPVTTLSSSLTRVTHPLDLG